MGLARLFALIYLVVFAGVVQGAGYRLEAAAAFADGDGGDTETELLDLAVTWYFDQVEPGDFPLAEAGFMSRQSSASYQYLDEESEVSLRPLFGVINPITPSPGLTGSPLVPPGGGGLTNRPIPPPTITLETDTESHVANIRYVRPSGWVFGLRGSILDGDGFGNADLEGDNVGISVGRYVAPTTTLDMFAERESLESKSSVRVTCGTLFVCTDLVSRSATDNEADSIGVRVRHVGRLADRHFALSGFVRHTDIDIDFFSRVTLAGDPFVQPEPFRRSQSVSSVWQAGVASTWYFNRRLGVSAEIIRLDRDDDQDMTYSVSTSWFVTSRIELQFRYTWTHLEGPRDDVDQWRFAVGGRI